MKHYVVHTISCRCISLLGLLRGCGVNLRFPGAFFLSTGAEVVTLDDVDVDAPTLPSADEDEEDP